MLDINSTVLAAVLILGVTSVFFLWRTGRGTFQKLTQKHLQSVFLDNALNFIASRLEAEIHTRSQNLHSFLSQHNGYSVLTKKDLLQLSRISKTLEDISCHAARLFALKKENKSSDKIQFRIEDLVAAAISQFSDSRNISQSDIATHYAVHPQTVLEGNPTLLQELLHHLVAHVWSRAEGGCLNINISLIQNRSDSRIRISLTHTRDAGSNTVSESLFLPWVSGSISSRPTTGLELTLAKALGFRLDATLQVFSSDVRGTTFSLTVPLRVVAVEEKQQLELSSAMPTRSTSGKSALVIDDNPNNASSLRDILHSLGHRVEVYHSGREALQHVRTQNQSSTATAYDFLFLDDNIEDFEFAVVMHYVHANPNTFQRVLVSSQKEHKRGKEEPDVDAVIRKPYHVKNIESALAQLQSSPTHKTQEPPIVSPIAPEEHPRNIAATLPELTKKIKFNAGEKRNLTCLLVDDNLVNMHTFSCILRQNDVEVLVAENGKDALDVYLQNTDILSFILMDVQMPEMDGCEATQRIRKLETTTSKHIPIIALTAYANKEERKRCLDAGMDAFVSKGVTPEALFDTINSLGTKTNRKVVPASTENSTN
jgi:two-component system sensor histidine kinase/response regulator